MGREHLKQFHLYRTILHLFIDLVCIFGINWHGWMDEWMNGCSESIHSIIFNRLDTKRKQHPNSMIWLKISTSSSCWKLISHVYILPLPSSLLDSTLRNSICAPWLGIRCVLCIIYWVTIKFESSHQVYQLSSKN